MTWIGAGAATVAGLVAVSYMTSGGTAVEPLVDLNNQSVAIDGKPEHRASWLNNSPDYTNVDRVFPDVRSTNDIWTKGMKVSGNGPCLGARTGPNKTYEWMNYQQVIDATHNFGSAMVERGAAACNDTRVGLFLANRPEWCIADYGCQAYSMVPVPIYDTFGLQAAKHIIDQCEMKFVVCDSAARVKTLLKLKHQSPEYLKTIVYVEDIGDELIKEAAQAGVDLIQYSEMIAIGKKYPHPPNPPQPDDLFSIMYTSGTTGNPKGTLITQHGAVSMIKSLIMHFKGVIEFHPGDVHLSFLPLAHTYERLMHVNCLLHGVRIGYYSGDIKLLTDDLTTLKPTLFPSVPRLLNRIYDAVQSELKKSRLKATLFNWAIASKKRDIENRIYRNDTIWDKLVFRKIQKKLGGRVRAVLTGSAPISEDVMTFLRCALGCVVVEGYGQTETCAGSTCCVPGDPTIGHVGAPLPGCQIKLMDVPEMDYYATDNIGEICVKSDFMLKGYFKDAERTREAIDDEGWLHTGDVGSWTPHGCLKIVDRKKNIFKLAQGEYIATEKIESVYMNSPFTAQCFIDGDSLKTCVMGVIVPDELYIKVWAPKNGYPSDLKEFCSSKGAKDAIMKDILSQGKANGLKGFEQVKDIKLEPEMWSVENDLLTPTFKNKRPTLRKKYKADISSLYDQHGL